MTSMVHSKVVALSGGVGGAKLALGLAQILEAEELTPSPEADKAELRRLRATFSDDPLLPDLADADRFLSA